MLRTQDGRVRSWAVALVLVALVPMTAGCFGRFPLTKAVYKFNKDVSQDEVVQSVAFWALMVVPVYGAASLADVLVIHLLEFWSGDRVDVGRVTAEDGAELVLRPSADGREAVLTVSKAGQVVSRTTFVWVSDTECAVRGTGGTLAGKVLRSSDGGLRLTDASGATVRTLSAEALAAVPSR